MTQPEKNKSYKIDQSTLISLEKGKIPPQAVDLEEVVLGAMMIDKNGHHEAFEVLSDNDEVFYKEAHQLIFKACLELYNKNEPIDLVTVSTQLKTNGKLELVGGDFYLISLTQKVSSSAHIEFHCRILMQKYTRRQVIKVSNRNIEHAYSDESDPFKLLDYAQQKLDETAQWLFRKKPTDLKTAFGEFLTKQKQPTAGIQSKFTKIRKKLSYHPGDLVIVAARPGMGKTALALNEAKYIAKQNIPVGFLSLEMMTNQLIGRLVAEEFGIEANRIKENNLTPSEEEVITKEAHKISELPLYIHDEGGLSTMNAKAIIGKWVREYGVKIVFIDYLQLMKAHGGNWNGNREQEVSNISGSLKAFAKEFEITIVALSQLSRAVELRGGMKRPQLSDLRDSGSIEQDADVVVFLLRPEYYKIEFWDNDERTPTEGQVEFNIAKIREGETGATILSSKLKYMRIGDLESNDWTSISEETPYQDLPKETPENAFKPVENNIDDDDNYDLPF